VEFKEKERVRKKKKTSSSHLTKKRKQDPNVSLDSKKRRSRKRKSVTVGTRVREAGKDWTTLKKQLEKMQKVKGVKVLPEIPRALAKKLN